MANAPCHLRTGDGRSPRVAVVDPNRANAAVTALLVEQFGGLAIEVQSGAALLALLRGREPIDLIVLDLLLPDMDGLAAVELVGQQLPGRQAPILALATDGSRVSAGSRGIAGLITKPYSPRELHAAMEAALAQRVGTSADDRTA